MSSNPIFARAINTDNLQSEVLVLNPNPKSSPPILVRGKTPLRTQVFSVDNNSLQSSPINKPNSPVIIIQDRASCPAVPKKPSGWLIFCIVLLVIVICLIIIIVLVVVIALANSRISS